MTDDIRERLRALAPELADPPDRFAAVSRRVAHRRRSLIATETAAVVVLAVVATLVAIGSSRGHSRHQVAGPVLTGPVAVLTCPEVFGGKPPWVPAGPTGVDGHSRLVPVDVPARALVCAYPGTNYEKKQSGWKLGSGRTLSAGLDRLAAELTWLPRGRARGGVCSAVGGPQTDYLIGLSYPGGVVWVSSADEPNQCIGTSNGNFASRFGLGDLTAAIDTGRWPAPPAPGPGGDPCQKRAIGRLGQETRMVPDRPESVQICEITLGGKHEQYRTVTVRKKLGDLVDALNRPPVTLSSWGCQGLGHESVVYEARFAYAEGPDVLVRVDPHCDPSIDNRSLQARDAGQVVAILRRLLG